MTTGEHMEHSFLFHRPKSEYAYAYDKEHIQLLLRTKRNDFSSVFLRYGDPFEWITSSDKSLWVYHEEEMHVRYQTHDYDYYFIQVQPKTKRLQYAFILYDKVDVYAFTPRGVISDHEKMGDMSYFKFPYLHESDLHETPSWVKDRMWYQIFVDRFSPDPDHTFLTPDQPVQNAKHYGGTLKGITYHLDYLKDLGINGIYLTPIFLSPTAHKYDTTDYFQIDPNFGTKDDLIDLVKKAHSFDIKVILDGVFNHAGFFHPFFQDVIKHEQISLYQDCFYIKRYPVVNFPLNGFGKPINYRGIPLNYETFSFQPSMPKWRTSNPIVQNYLLDVVSYWIRETDIDGWRLDVSNELSHDFLRQIKKRARSVKQDSVIIGENWDESLPWLMGDQLDSVMNYELSFVIWDFISNQISTEKFIEIVTEQYIKTPKSVLENLFNHIGCHDTMRIKTRCHNNTHLVKIAYLLMFLSPGTPMIYYGDEIGLEGEHDPDNRRLFSWDQTTWDMDVYDFIKRLISLRKQDNELFNSECQLAYQDHVLIMTKDANHKKLIAIINPQDRELIISTKSMEGSYRDIIHDQMIDIHDTIKMKGQTFHLLFKEDL